MATEKHASTQSHASWIIALVVGLVVGAVGARMAGVGGGSGGAVDVPAGWVKESDLPPGTLAGLSAQQKRTVLKGVTERYGGSRPQAPQPPRPQEDPRAVYRVPVDDSPAKGPADALVTVVESSDFECPFCKRALPTMKQIEEAYPGKVRFVFKHNPLPFHPKALPSAMAAEEARAQGGDARFWAMHDKLFELSPALERPGLEKAAQDLGLDLGAFRRALDGAKHQGRIERDQALVRGLGAGGTPTFFVNGRKIAGAVPFEAFKPVIDEELQKAEAMVKAGTPAREVYARIAEKGATAPVMLAGAAAPPPQAPPPPPPPAARRVPLRADDPMRGPTAAKVTLVVFSDFQCPFCARVEPTLKQLQDAYKGDLRVVWKNQPLPMHPQAMPAALAAEAAREQGKFWPMHDLMFANQPQLAPGKYEEWAKQVGLDARKFKTAVESPRAKARVEEDVKLGNSVGANGTPTSFVNCRQLVGAVPFESFKQMVDEELRKASALLAKGGKLDAGFYDRACEENLKAIAAAAPAAAAPPAGPVAVAIRPDDPVKGNPRASVTIVEFSDFQCPFCSRVLPTLKQVEKDYGGKVRLVWKHQPLGMHPQALPAALAAEAARQQGRFWEMHDKLFENQRALDPPSLERYAQEVGLDLARFRAAQDDPKLKGRVEEDQAQAARLGISGTPSFLVNGEKLIGAQPYEKFKEVIDAQLQRVARK
ncbi:MAG TPA: thioredoxin domain-containing protein [Anaeromyxobacteraceae bacterium]|nr:thioredoxin domain-containing protein [Anaeromyxobacteraceae bacterium]